MKKIKIKDAVNRKKVKKSELKWFVLKQIYTNSNFFKLLRWNALNKLNNFFRNGSKTFLSNRCVKTTNKKTFHKFSNFSRIVFLRFAKSGFVSGLRKSCW